MKARTDVTLVFLCILVGFAPFCLGDGDDAWQRGLQAFKAGKYADAAQYFSAVIDNPATDDEGRADAYINRGTSYLAAGSPDKAVADFTEALRLAPTKPGLYMNRGVAWGRLRQYDRALADFDEELKRDPKNAEALYNRGRVYASAGDMTRALADVSEALALKPDFTSAAIQQAKWLAAERKTDRALAILDNNLKVNEQPLALVARANLLMERGRHKEALADLTRAIELKPDLPEALGNRGYLLNGMGRYDEALLDLNRAVALDPEKPAYLMNRTKTYVGLNRPEEALADCDKVISLQSKADPRAFINRGTVHMMRGDYEAAIVDFTSAVDSPGAPPEALFCRGYAFLGTGALASSRKDLKSYSEKAPKDRYGVLMYYLAVARDGGDASAILLPYLGAGARDWEGTLIMFLGGKITEKDLFRFIADSDPGDVQQRTCEGRFYAGEACLIQGDVACARSNFLAVQGTKLVTFVEYQVASAELRRITSAPK
jgi:tetratricopeptide (TPR) repeat protein